MSGKSTAIKESLQKYGYFTTNSDNIYISTLNKEFVEYNESEDYLLFKDEKGIPLVTLTGKSINTSNLNRILLAYDYNTTKGKKEVIVCSAMYVENSIESSGYLPINKWTGFVVCGPRHNSCFKIYEALSKMDYLSSDCIDGFITNRERFLSRQEAGKFAYESGQVKIDVGDFLTSEDLY